MSQSRGAREDGTSKCLMGPGTEKGPQAATEKTQIKSRLQETTMYRHWSHGD